MPARSVAGRAAAANACIRPRFVRAFTAVSGGQTRLEDLRVTIAAALTAHALNVGFAPVISGMPALTRARRACVLEKS